MNPVRLAAALLVVALSPSAWSQQAGETARVILRDYISTQLAGIAQFQMTRDELGIPKGTAILTRYSVGPGPFSACVFRIIKPNGASTFAGDKCLAIITPLPETKIDRYPRELQIDGGQILLMTWGGH